MKENNFPINIPMNSETLIEERLKQFSLFVKAGGYTPDQVREAYYQAMGVSDDKNEDETIKTIATEMESMIADRFPVNRFVVFIEKEQEREDAMKAYMTYVENLQLSQKEKNMLLSILKKRRNGELEFLIDGKPSVRVDLEIENAPDTDLAIELLKIFKQCIDKVPAGEKYEFIFTC